MANSINTLGDQVRGFGALPLERQIGLILAIAASITFVVSLALWVSRPSYVTLFPNLTSQESSQVMQSLDQHGLPYRLSPDSGIIQVPAARVHEARLKLATDGLPRRSGFGFELLEQDTGLGTSRLIEDARYHRAIEGELARSIATLDSVESARVHLALPRQSLFVRDRTRPTASVLLNLYAGRTIDEHRVAGIVHLVSSSIPELEPDAVTVVDQRGRLLTQPSGSEGFASGHQLDYTRRIEEGYVRRIMDLIGPIVGADGLRAQVAAEIDFSRVERTSEQFDPERAGTFVRSEQVSEDETRGSMGAMGVPGALANQPPGAGIAGAGQDNQPRDGQGGDAPENRSTRTVRNFEMDRVISHVREAPGGIRRLSVAVVVDHVTRVNEAGDLERGPLDDLELERITTLVREAVGFNAARGDSVNVINTSFRTVEIPDPEPVKAPIWQDPWLVDLAKTGLGVLIALILVFTVIKPILRGLAQRGAELRAATPPVPALPAGAAAADGGSDRRDADGSGVPALAGEREMDALAPPDSPAGRRKRHRDYETNLEAARAIVREDPGTAAQVMRHWMTEGGEGG
jgi:flagellar M-ring protein FliF